jgi:hypothetical protein
LWEVLFVKIKTDELTGAALNYAVAKCGGRDIEFDDPREPWLTRDGIADQPLHSYTPSTDWAQGGPIIEQERIATEYEVNDDEEENWMACVLSLTVGYYGPTPLVAAMRCYVASKLGDGVDVPEELL